jgi:hypothetical protein
MPCRSGRARKRRQDGDAPEAAASSDLVHVALDRTDMLTDGKREDSEPGVTAIAEIKTGSRRVISYLPVQLARYERASRSGR